MRRAYRAIDDLYRELCAAPSDIHEHLPTLVELATSIQATTVIELGVRHGVSTAAWLHAMEQTGGHLWSVDRYFPTDDAPIHQISHDRWTFVLGHDERRQTLAVLPASCDIVFIDTSHTLLDTTHELEIYGARVRPGGYIVLHDTQENAVEPGYPVRTAIERYTSPRRLTWMEYPNNNGLGVIAIPALGSAARPV